MILRFLFAWNHYSTGGVDLIHFRVVIVSYCFLNYNLQLEYTFIHQIKKTNVA